MVNVVIVEPPPNTVVITDSWIKAVMTDIPVLEYVGVTKIPPAGAEAPPLESIRRQAADVID